MKLKFLLPLFVLVLFFGYTNVHASSINYNLQIDNNMTFHEKITYNIDSKDIKRDGNYHFLTNVLDSPVYFDLNEEIEYNKSKSTSSSGYIVTLQNDYPYMFLSKSRILNECFTTRQINNSSTYVSLSASEFYCTHRADNIKVVINTGLKVISSNASSHNGNTYIWDDISDEFSLSFKVQIPPVEEDPMDQTSEVEESTTDVNTQTKKNNNISFIVILSAVGVLFVSLLVTMLILKKKKNSLDNF